MSTEQLEARLRWWAAEEHQQGRPDYGALLTEAADALAAMREDTELLDWMDVTSVPIRRISQPSCACTGSAVSATNTTSDAPPYALPSTPHGAHRRRRAMSERESEFWSCFADQERLSATTIEEAVQDFIDGMEEGEILPDTLTVYRFTPMELPKQERIADRVMEYLTEWLEDEYGDPDEWDGPTIPAALSDAAMTFAAAVREHYPVRTCTRRAGEERTVRVADYRHPMTEREQLEGGER